MPKCIIITYLSAKKSCIFSRSGTLGMIVFNNVTKKYGNNVGLINASVHINSGDFVFLVGPSGAGKTTYLNAVNGYEKAKAEVILNGRNMYKEYKDMQYDIGFVPQQDLMRGSDTVFRTLMDAATLRLIVSGQGNMKLMKAPKVDFPQDFEIYDPKVDDKTTNTSAGAKGNVVYDDIEDPLPFDVEADHIVIEDQDYALWYRDMSEEPKKYEGKTVRFKAKALKRKRLPPKTFVIGRHVMTCCVEDIQFAALVCNWDKADSVTDEGWMILTAKINFKFSMAYGRKGPVLTYISHEDCEPPEQAVATFY